MDKKKTVILGIVFLIGLMLTGCTGYYGGYGYSDDPYSGYGYYGGHGGGEQYWGGHARGEDRGGREHSEHYEGK